MEYKKSEFNFVVEMRDSVFIYNTLYNSLSCLNQKEYKAYQGEKYSKEMKEILIKQKILIPQQVDEIKNILFRYNKSTYSNAVVSFRILTTNLCNARCFYCYEENKENYQLQIADAKKLINFIIDKSVGIEKINLTWFGGEPLLNWKFIDEFYKELYLSEAMCGKKIRTSIITNGTLLSDLIIEKMVSYWKVNDIQITFDGFSEEHNIRKNYYSIKNAFDKTMLNLKKICHTNIMIHLRLNYDNQNINSLLELISYFDKEITNKENIDIYSYPLFDIKDKSFNVAVDIKKNDYILKAKLLKLGFIKPNISKPRNANCFATSPNGYVINADGTILKCTMCIGKNKYSYGNFITGFEFGSSYLDWIITDFNETCKKCKILPLCLGGCQAKKLLGMTDYCSIKKYTLENEIKIFLKECVKIESNY